MEQRELVEELSAKGEDGYPELLKLKQVTEEKLQHLYDDIAQAFDEHSLEAARPLAIKIQ